MGPSSLITEALLYRKWRPSQKPTRMKRVVDCGKPSISRYMYIIGPLSISQGTLQKRDCKDYKSQHN